MLISIKLDCPIVEQNIILVSFYFVLQVSMQVHESLLKDLDPIKRTIRICNVSKKLMNLLYVL